MSQNDVTARPRSLAIAGGSCARGVRPARGSQRVRRQNRVRFFAIAARVMRRVLVDPARSHDAVKRGGAKWKVALSARHAVTDPRELDLLDLEAVLDKRCRISPRLGDLVTTRFLVGLTIEETAEALDSSAAISPEDATNARLR